MPEDRWQDATSYERFMGRWSRELARELVSWLEAEEGADWLEVGCGTGALTSAICELGSPASVVACDLSSDYVRHTRESLPDPRLTVVEIAPDELPARAGGFDLVVSSLVLNFLPAPVDALARMRDSCRAGGLVAAAVWDYSDGMEFLRLFWDAVTALDPAAAALDEGQRFPICRPEPLRAAFERADLRSTEVRPITIRTQFTSFDDFWAPFLDGPGPAPGYVASLSPAARARLEAKLRDELARRGPIDLRARAWAARGVTHRSDGG